MNEDCRLVHFLQHHRPAPPPAPIQAEAQLMQALAKQSRPWRIPRIAVGAMLGLVVAGSSGAGWWFVQRRAIALAETQRLETALLEEWNTSLTLADAFYVDFAHDERP